MKRIQADLDPDPKHSFFVNLIYFLEAADEIATTAFLGPGGGNNNTFIQATSEIIQNSLIHNWFLL